MKRELEREYRDRVLVMVLLESGTNAASEMESKEPKEMNMMDRYIQDEVKTISRADILTVPVTVMSDDSRLSDVQCG